MAEYREVLGVSEGASFSDIKKAYEGIEKSQNVTEAYEYFCFLENMEAADKSLEEWLKKAEEIFKQRFQRGRGNSTFSNDSASLQTKYFAILEVPAGTPFTDIRRAYHRLAMQHHPDKNPDNAQEANEKFQKIIEAYSYFERRKNNEGKF